MWSHPLYEAAFWLVSGHALVDFSLQNDTLAREKSRHSDTPLQKVVPWGWWLTAHALMHGMPVMFVTHRVDLAVGEVVAHWCIDFAKCEKSISLPVDQGLHILCKVLWLAIWWIGSGQPT